MNDLGKRLDDLAGSATAGTTLLDPSRRAVTTERPFRRRSLVIAVAALVAVVASLAVWQGRDGSTTSVVAGQGDGQETSVPLSSDSCDLDAILPVLRAEVPTYDYEPAGSYAALAESSAVVVTGKVVSAVRAEVNGLSYIELTTADVARLQDDLWSESEVDVIAYDAVWADRSRPDPLASPAAFDDLTFVAFLSPYSGVRGGWAPGPEGLYVGCGDQPLEAVFNDAAGPDDPTGWNADLLAAVVAAHLAAEQSAADGGTQAVDQTQQADANRSDEQAALYAARVAAENVRRIEQERIAALGINPPATIAEARALWDAAAVATYRMRYSELRPAASFSLFSVRVENGLIIDTNVEVGFDEDAGLTVDDLFDLAESADTVREIEFDPTRGFPTILSLDPNSGVPGDELSLLEITLDSQAELDVIDVRLQAWLPQSVDAPEGMLHASPGQRGIELSQVSLLHEEPELDAFVYVANDDVCVRLLFKIAGGDTVEYSDESVGTCVPTVGFETRPIVVSSTRSSIGSDFQLVVQSLDAFDQGWAAEADGGRLSVTTRSALVIVTDEAPAPLGRVLLEIACPCGDATYQLPLG